MHTDNQHKRCVIKIAINLQHNQNWQHFKCKDVIVA